MGAAAGLWVMLGVLVALVAAELLTGPSPAAAADEYRRVNAVVEWQG
jgi:hypothetical protein